MNLSTNHQWYKTFFQGVTLEFWRNVVPPEFTTLEVSFLENLFALPRGSRILDVPCGNGRHSIELARKGYQVTGIDISEEYVTEARQYAEAEKLPMQVIEADMLNAELGDMYDGAFCFGNSFGYFDYEGMQRFVGNTAAHLKPGAKFIINSGIIAEVLLPNLEQRSWFRAGEILMLIENHYEPMESVLETQLTFIHNGEEEKRAFSHWVYTLAEIKRLLKQAKLELVAAYGSTDLVPFRVGDQQVYMVAVKQP